MNLNKKLWIQAECAICVAIAAVLSLFTIFRMPLGGSITPFATLPIIVVSLRHGTKWGVVSALAFSLTQLFLGMSDVMAVPAKNIESMALCAMLDYILAYMILGLTGYIAGRFKNRGYGISAGILVTGCGRLTCSFISGVLIWDSFTPEGWNVALYSLVYNATWCLPDTAITLAACLLLLRVGALNLFLAEKTASEGR